MIRLTPSYFPALNKRQGGEAEGIVLFVDLAGFTALTGTLLRFERSGAELLSELLNKVFTSLINPIEIRGGDILFFAGDAFAAYFPNDAVSEALQAAIEMRDNAQVYSTIKTKLGEFSLSVRIGVSVGTLLWGIVGDESSGIWFVKGTALDAAAEAERRCQPGEVLLDASLTPFLPEDTETESAPSGRRVLHSVSHKTITAPTLRPSINEPNDPYFVSDRVKEITVAGEFREVASLFISLDGLNEYDDIAAFMKTVFEAVHYFGGFVSGMIFGEKNGYALLVFGAPTAYEDSRERAVRCVDMIRQHQSHSFAAGLTYGIVFAGFVGSKERAAYTVIGDRVNLAARILMKTPAGETRIATDDRGKLGQTYTLEDVGSFSFKGFENPIAVSRIANRRPLISPIAFSSPMVGREEELNTVLEGVYKLLDGTFGGIFAIEGDAGSGKSRLAAEVAHAMPDVVTPLILQSDALLSQSLNPFISFFSRTFSVLSLADENDKKEAFNRSWEQFISHFRDSHPDDYRTMEDELQRARPFLAALIGIGTELGELYDVMSAEERLNRTRYAIRTWFRAWSVIEPLLLIFEDSEHMDYDSQEVVRLFPRQSERFPVTILWLSRLNEHHEFVPPPIDEDIEYVTIKLDGFDEKGSEDFIAHHLNAKPHHSLVTFIHEKSNGNPFYIEQLLTYLQDHNMLKEKNGLLMSVSSDVVLPSEINSLLMSQIDRLSPHLRKSVLAASVQGAEIDVTLLSHIVDIPDISTVMNEGERLGIWREFATNSYTFRYPLMRETAYEMQLKSDVRKLHALMAKTILDVYGEHPDRFAILAFHYDRADVRDKAVHYLRLAGKRAEEHSYNLEAIAHYTRLAEILDDTEEKADIFITLGILYTLTGKWDTAEEVLNQALTLERNIDNPLLKARIWKRMGYLWLEKGKYTEADEILRDAEQVFSELGEEAGVSEVLGYRGLIHYYRGELDAAVESFKEQLAIAERRGDRATVALVNKYLGGVAFYQGKLDDALAHYQINMEIVMSLGVEKDIGVAYNNLGLVHSHMKKFEQALDYYSKAMAIHEKLGIGQYIVYTANNMGELYTWLGRYEEAIDSFLRQRNMALEMGNRRHVAVSNNGLGNGYKGLGMYDVAELYYEKSVTIAREMPLKNLLVEFLFEQADLYYRMEQFDTAAGLCTEAQERCIETGRNDMLFSIRLLCAKVAARRGEISAEHDVRKLLEEAAKPEEKADCYFVLADLFGDKESIAEAQHLYTELAKTASLVLYNQRLERLSELAALNR